jgi:hypothetical protein
MIGMLWNKNRSKLSEFLSESFRRKPFRVYSVEFFSERNSVANLSSKIPELASSPRLMYLELVLVGV